MVRRFLFGLAILSVTVLSIWMESPASADEGGIRVLEAGAENQYPNAVRFYLTAGSNDEIEEIRVFFKKTGKVTVRTYQTLDFQSDKLVSAEALLQTGRGPNYIPPGTEVSYFFEIRDAIGATHRTPDRKIVYTDSRFQWLTLSSGVITVYYYGEGGETRAQPTVDAARKTLERTALLLGFDPSELVRIVSYRSYDDMRAALPFNLRIREGPIRTEGIAFGDERVVLVPGLGASVKGVTSHEIVHLAVAEVTGRAHTRVPTWLNEGLAEFANLEPFAEHVRALRRGILNDSVKPLWALGTFWGDGDDILTAYGQGQSVVRHLVSNYGEEKIAELMQAIRSSFDIDQALEMVYGFDQYDLDAEWRRSVGLEPLPRPEERNLLALPDPTATPTAVPTPTPEPTSTPARPTLAATSSTPAPPTAASRPSPTPLPPASTPGPTVVNAVEDKDGGATSAGCSGSLSGRSGASGGDLAMMAMLAGPLAMLAFRCRLT